MPESPEERAARIAPLQLQIDRFRHRADHCVTIAEGIDTPVSLYQSGVDRFAVIYGLDFKRDLTYSQAATALGAAIMHSTACASKLDNRTIAEAWRYSRFVRIE